jgi:hypothetical protein
MIQARALSTFDFNPRRKLSRATNNQPATTYSSYFNLQLSTFDPQPTRKPSRTPNKYLAVSSSYFNFQLPTVDSLFKTHAH